MKSKVVKIKPVLGHFIYSFFFCHSQLSEYYPCFTYMHIDIIKNRAQRKLSTLTTFANREKKINSKIGAKSRFQKPNGHLI